MRPWLPLAATLAAASSVGVAHAGPALPRVAIVIDLAANVEPARATELGRAMAEAFARVLELEAIGGDDVARRLPPGGVPEECVASPACIADLGARLDAEQLVFLTIAQVATTVRVDATWVDVATGRAATRPRLELSADARAGEVFAAEAGRVLPTARARPRPTADAPPPRPRRHLTRGVWLAGGLGAAALAGGLGLALDARGTYDRCERDPDGCDDDTRDGIGREALAADLLFAGALAGAATATILYLRSARLDEPAAALTVHPTRGGGLAELRVRF